MRDFTIFRCKHAAFAVLLWLPLAAAAAAASGTQLQSLSKMRAQIVGVDHLMRGYVGNGVNTIGDVTNLVLSPDHTQVQYVLFDSVYPMSLYGVRNEFVPYNDVHFVNGDDFVSRIVVEGMKATRGPEELKLNPGQAADRLVAGIIGKPLFFADGNSRRITDMLIDPNSGKVLDYVVDKDPASLVRPQPRTVPADKVAIKQDRVSTSVTMRDLEDLQRFGPAFL